MKKLVLVLAAGLSLGSAVAHADIINIEWAPDGRFAKELVVPAGKFAEVCGKLPAKAVVQWSFETDARMDFNVHYHEGKKVAFPAKLDGSQRANGILTAAVAQDFCWMWSNKSAGDAKLTFELQKATAS